MTVLAIFVSILLQLNADGSANVTENWDVNVANGTEWYLVKSNLGDIEIKDFSVSENGRQFITEGDWDVDRSLEEKAGFRKFLNDFTLIELRGSAEVGLWQDYLVFGALYGIADKVARELKEINPELFGETISYDYETTRQLIWLTRNMASGITNARAAQSSGASRGGFGGVSSFGGGGGFSGGGFGGGAR